MKVAILNTQICTKCVMDTTDTELRFDERGVCSICHEAELRLPDYDYSEDQAKENLRALASKVKASRKGDYDSVIGLSGGVDSSYVAAIASDLGLNPLCVHFDNGWNSEIAVRNIQKIVEKCGFDLITYVIDWTEFRDLQRAFLRADVIDLEMLSDHAIFASMLKLCRKHKLKYILSGTNYRTEHGLPNSWIWQKMDWRNIRSIHKEFGEVPLKTFPHIGNLGWLLMRHLNLGAEYLEPLNLINYNKSNVMRELHERFDWQYYGGKHYESTITHFYQAHILPSKFGVDKRKCHLSALVRSGEMTRDQALLELETPLYKGNDLEIQRDFVLKKLGFTKEEFEAIMSRAPKPHDDYASDQVYIRPLIRLAKSILGRDA